MAVLQKTVNMALAAVLFILTAIAKIMCVKFSFRLYFNKWNRDQYYPNVSRQIRER